MVITYTQNLWTSWEQQPCSCNFIVGNNYKSQGMPNEVLKGGWGPQTCFYLLKIALASASWVDLLLCVKILP